jgi:hypothetical protein
MRNLFRTPLTWMVLAEIVVVGALIALAWNVMAPGVRPPVAMPGQSAPEGVASDDGAAPDLPTLALPGSRGPLPGLNVSPAFWRERLAELNRDEAWVVGLEWRLLHVARDAARDYLESVVLPAVRKAERAAASPAPTAW